MIEVGDRWRGVARRPVAQLLAIVGKGLCDLRGVGEADDHGDVVRAHLIDQFDHTLLGLSEPRGSDVRGRHAGRVVDQENVPTADQLRGFQDGRSSASMTSATSNNCNSSRCSAAAFATASDVHILDVRRQRYVLGTSNGTRRNLRKYNATIVGGTSPSAAHCRR